MSCDGNINMDSYIMTCSLVPQAVTLATSYYEFVIFIEGRWYVD